MFADFTQVYQNNMEKEGSSRPNKSKSIFEKNFAQRMNENLLAVLALNNSTEEEGVFTDQN